MDNFKLEFSLPGFCTIERSSLTREELKEAKPLPNDKTRVLVPQEIALRAFKRSLTQKHERN